jgi:hypothetical protein
MCALEGRQHGNRSRVNLSLYRRGPMAKESKEGSLLFAREEV